MPSDGAYVNRAEAQLLELVNVELALAIPELEARIAEGNYQESNLNIDPHHITTAQRRLLRDGLIIRAEGPTRGGRSIITVEPADQRLRATRVARVAAR